MKWTTEKPTEPGWYWSRVVLLNGREMPKAKGEIDYWSIVDIDGLDELYESGSTFEWAGPIPEPSEE